MLNEDKVWSHYLGPDIVDLNVPNLLLNCKNTSLQSFGKSDKTKYYSCVTNEKREPE